ncbi:MAG: hypothetical protein IAE99_12295 [Rhodothermales bacterium]|nr:hypothetical protein [Rhodothermales bacterium]
MIYGRRRVYVEHGFNTREDVCLIAERVAGLDLSLVSMPLFVKAVESLRALYQGACERGDVVFCLVD